MLWAWARAASYLPAHRPEKQAKTGAEPMPFSEAVRPAGGPQPVTASDFLIEDDRVVEVGDRVVVSYNDDPGNPKTLVLTQEQADDPKMGMIFVGRPLGKALIGQSEEEVVELPAGDRVREATILRIEKRALAA
jgi:Transcription elongation factor, GreA/GreB, C-term